MAEAKICDRCGKVYKGADAFFNSRYTVFDTYGYDYDTHQAKCFGKTIGSCVDLCKSCSNALQDWFEKKSDDPF